MGTLGRRRRRGGRAAAVSVILALTGGCGLAGLGEPVPCTLIGALDGISLRLPPSPADRLQVEVCQGETCRSGEKVLTRGTNRVDAPVAGIAQGLEAGNATVSVVLADRDGAGVRTWRRPVVLERSFPNGRRCDGDGYLNATIRLGPAASGPG